MSNAETLKQIRLTWISRVAHRMARGQEVRESFRLQLERFFDLLEHAILTGDPAWLNPILDTWIESRTQTELDAQGTSLPPILDQILMITHEIAVEILEADQALKLIGALLPVYTYAFEYTSRKETQRHIEKVSRELEQAQGALEKLDKSKSDFISIAAHELKTPLTLIEGYAAMLREQVKDSTGDDSPYIILLKGIDNGTRRLQEIVNDMIDVSMIDNNLLSLNFQPVWINRLFDVIEQEFTKIASVRKLMLQVSPFSGSGEMTFGDNERLYQAFRNLVSNAIKYTPDGGRITVDGRKLPGFIEVTITDTGIGIDPDDHIRIFEKFGRTGNTSLHSSGKTKFKGGGPGLGLSITKGIIEAHGGAIWVESEGYDETNCPGATFHVLLPLRKEAPDASVAKLFQSQEE
jgi:signal transduction histidine kinase